MAVTFIWITVFGNSAIYIELLGDGGIAKAVQENIPVSLFIFLETFPLTMVTSILAILVVITFFVTSSDSGSMVIDIITAGGNPDPPRPQRLFWAIMEGTVAAVLLMGGGLVALQTAAIANGLPFAMVVLRNTPYIKADTIADLKEYGGKCKHRIIGIDLESGIMQKTRETIEAYGLDNYELVAGSEISMTAELAHAIQRQKWVVVTGWVPHWKFAPWELKFLEDPKGIYGNKENIHTFVRKGLQEEMPKVYQFLDNFHWTPKDMGQLMIWIHDDDGMYPHEKALRFLRAKKDLVESWVP